MSIYDIDLTGNPGCCWTIHFPGLPNVPPDYDSLVWHYPTLNEARTEYLKRAREQEMPYLPATIDDALELIPAGLTQLDTPCREAICECGAEVHLRPGDRFECYMCSSDTYVIGGAA